MPLSYDDTQRLREFYKVCLDSQHQMLGYPVATDYDYQTYRLSSSFPLTMLVTGRKRRTTQ